MITLYWRGDHNNELVTRPEFDGAVFYVTVPRSISTGKALQLVMVSDAPNSDVVRELMAAYG